MSLLHRPGIETVADIQLVAQLWERLGWESLSLLEGMFALAIWDRECQQLQLVRDRPGSATLYYTTDASIRWIAPTAAILSPFRSDELDLVALRDYLIFVVLSYPKSEGFGNGCESYVPARFSVYRRNEFQSTLFYG